MLRYQIPGLLPSGAYPMRVQNLRARSGLGSGYMRDSSYRPLGLKVPSLGERRHRLGDFSWNRFPTSVLFLAGGAAGFYVSPLVPSPVDTILKAAAIASIGWGIYYLFGGPSTPSGAGQAPKKTPSTPAFGLIRGSIVSPVSGTKPNMNFWGESFDINVAWYNGSGEEANFTYDVLADSVATSGVPTKGENWVTQSIPPITISVPPIHDTGPRAVTIPVIRPPRPGLVGPGLPPPVVYMYLQLRKFDAQGNAVPVGESVKVGPFEFK